MAIVLGLPHVYVAQQSAQVLGLAPGKVPISLRTYGRFADRHGIIAQHVLSVCGHCETEKYLRKFCIESIQLFRSYRDHNISMATGG